jgi:hypothetical protein
MEDLLVGGIKVSRSFETTAVFDTRALIFRVSVLERLLQGRGALI